jgi:hypothetical protein
VSPHDGRGYRRRYTALPYFHWLAALLCGCERRAGVDR